MAERLDVIQCQAYSTAYRQLERRDHRYRQPQKEAIAGDRCPDPACRITNRPRSGRADHKMRLVCVRHAEAIRDAIEYDETEYSDEQLPTVLLAAKIQLVGNSLARAQKNVAGFRARMDEASAEAARLQAQQGRLVELLNGDLGQEIRTGRRKSETKEVQS